MTEIRAVELDVDCSLCIVTPYDVDMLSMLRYHRVQITMSHQANQAHLKSFYRSIYIPAQVVLAFLDTAGVYAEI